MSLPLYARPVIVEGQQCTTGAFAGANRGEEAYLDAHIGMRRGHAGVQHVSGRGLLSVGFDHRTSREGDPLLHTHLVVANRTQGPDGRWTALDGRDVYRHRLAADAIYRASYQRELSRSLGVEWTAADAHGNRELAGVPRGAAAGVLQAHRPDRSGGRTPGGLGAGATPRLVKWAVHATRKPRQHERPETLYERWRAEAAERGVDPDALIRQVTGRTHEPDRGCPTWPPSGHSTGWPARTSKWNRIEHRLCSAISMNWRGRPLASHEVIVELIGATAT